MATTVATNYGRWWMVDGTIANVGTWLADNNIGSAEVVHMTFDGTSGQIVLLVNSSKSGITTAVG